MSADLFMALERQIEFSTDCAEIQAYLRTTFSRTRLPRAIPNTPLDRAVLREQRPRELTFNERVLPLTEGWDGSPFHFGFYGASRLLRESFRQNRAWHSFHAVAVTVPRGALVFVGDSGTGKTTLALALLERGAKLLSDEFVFVRRADRLVSGYPRTLMIREPSLAELGNRRLTEKCAAAEYRRSSRGFAIWHSIEASEIYGPEIFAPPTGLAGVILVERGEPGAAARCEPLAAGLAALELSRRLNSGIEGFGRLSELADDLAAIPAARVILGGAEDAAELVEKFFA